MKARPFLAVVLAAVLSLLALGIGAWWLVLARSPLQLQHQALAMPLAARFVPRQAPLSLYLLSDGEQLEGYARAVAPGRRRRQAGEAIAQLRDGAFAVAGLDYRTELAGWLAPETGLALLANTGDGPPTGWLLSLRSRDADGARRFLQRFWQTRSLAGTDLQVSSYRGMGLISGRGALVGREAVPLATALINDNLVLIASGRGVLEQALDVSQIDELNQASSRMLKASLAQLGHGAALLTARPEALERWFGLPAPVAALGWQQLVAAIRPDGPGLSLEARLSLAQPWPTPSVQGSAQAFDQPSGQPLEQPLGQPSSQPFDRPSDPISTQVVGSDSAGQTLLESYRGDADSLALLVDPAHWPAELQPLLQASLGQVGSPMPSLVAAAANGPLLWAEGPMGWQLGTEALQPDPAELEPALAAQGLVAAPLDWRGRPVQVWTRLEAGKAAGHRVPSSQRDGQLQATLVGVRSVMAAGVSPGPTWWAQSLAGLVPQQEQRPGGRQRLAQLEALATPTARLRWAWSAAPAQELLRQWRPWQLLSTLAGQPLGGAIEGLAVAVQSDEAELVVKAQLRFG